MSRASRSHRKADKPASNAPVVASEPGSRREIGARSFAVSVSLQYRNGLAGKPTENHSISVVAPLTVARLVSAFEQLAQLVDEGLDECFGTVMDCADRTGICLYLQTDSRTVRTSAVPGLSVPPGINELSDGRHTTWRWRGLRMWLPAILGGEVVDLYAPESLTEGGVRLQVSARAVHAERYLGRSRTKAELADLAKTKAREEALCRAIVYPLPVAQWRAADLDAIALQIRGGLPEGKGNEYDGAHLAQEEYRTRTGVRARIVLMVCRGGYFGDVRLPELPGSALAEWLSTRAFRLDLFGRQVEKWPCGCARLRDQIGA